MLLFYGRKLMPLFFCALIASFMIISFEGDALAFDLEKPNLHIGALECHPYGSSEGYYDSNIYLEEKNNENQDFVFDTQVGVMLKSPLLPEREEDFLGTAYYHMDIINFAKNSHRDRVDHHAGGLFDLDFANDFALRIKDDFDKTADPPNSERTTLDKRYRNTFNTTLNYDRDKIGLGGGYRMVRDGYNELTMFDKYDNRLTGTFFYQVAPKTKAFVEYNLGFITYDLHETNSDSVYNQLRVGATGEYWPKVTGTVKFGFRAVDYHRESSGDYYNATAFANLKYDVSERTAINLSGDRTTNESTYASNAYFEKNKLALKINHDLMERVSCNGGSFIQYNRYPEDSNEAGEVTKRKDVLWGANIGLKYDIKDWIITTAGYEFKQRDSKFNTFDYYDHKVSTKLAIAF
ncbi:outer membrane beta-barrel protein [Candidatus Omnitrophota bacterium]